MLTKIWCLYLAVEERNLHAIRIKEALIIYNISVNWRSITLSQSVYSATVLGNFIFSLESLYKHLLLSCVLFLSYFSLFLHYITYMIFHQLKAFVAFTVFILFIILFIYFLRNYASFPQGFLFFVFFFFAKIMTLPCRHGLLSD